ncbi:MAG: Asp-tRNA(Asn)/Glu-tRNA(Gln) amidotransferase subunit GatC [Chloroflexota bacterium]|nr:Asp-tRNA(Asn)/Glu-tRNA(Gln) amidotransferase subunit GatC [Chloroflexota bacterium]
MRQRRSGHSRVPGREKYTRDVSEIDPGVVRYVADLARIALTDEEVDRFAAQLSVVLDAVGKLREVDTEHISPTASVLPLENVLREDEAREGLTVEEAMRNAPARDGDLFRVQTVIEERPSGG